MDHKTYTDSEILSILVSDDREDFETAAWKECCKVDQ